MIRILEHPNVFEILQDKRYISDSVTGGGDGAEMQMIDRVVDLFKD